MQADLTSAFCPKCHLEMAFVAAIPHSKSAMLKTTFLCQSCNRTWSYMLSTEMADRYQPEPPDQPTEAA